MVPGIVTEGLSDAGLVVINVLIPAGRVAGNAVVAGKEAGFVVMRGLMVAGRASDGSRMVGRVTGDG